MQEQTVARAGLNGSGAGYDVAPIPDMETMPDVEGLAPPAAERGTDPRSPQPSRASAPGGSVAGYSQMPMSERSWSVSTGLVM